jgi:hypothetical protein
MSAAYEGREAVSRDDVLEVFAAGEVIVELPKAWARPHARLDVALRQHDEFGLHASLVGDDGESLLDFPWHDHVDRTLLEQDRRELPGAGTQPGRMRR